MRQRYFIQFSYDGTSYHGWQIQPSGMSVQEKMTVALRLLFGPDLHLTGAGRTDAGVHALKMMAHFDTDYPIDDTASLVFKLNGMLPRDIAIQHIWRVIPEAHARFDALSRTYEYRLSTVKDPFTRAYSLPFYADLDMAAMNEAAACLLDYTDFTSFSKLHSQVKTHDCQIYRACWERRGPMLVFTIEANRFLRNMVRAIVGTLLEVGRGKIDKRGFQAVIEAGDRQLAGTSVAAKGLFLVDVSYPSSLFLPE
jgi:tRNA pseudouridine38-40 synthase